MFSGEDSSGDALNNAGQFATWAISQTTCNPGSDQVDWAALAQQWIKMKESASYTAPPLVPPPAPVVTPLNAFEEKGEADMEVVKEDEIGFPDSVTSSSAETGNNAASAVYRVQPEWQSSWYQDQSQWRPGWTNWPAANQPAVNIHEIHAPPAPSMTIVKPASPIAKVTPPEPPAVNSTLSAESIKRKTLPAWIREGLEKMEKEKLKQLERHKDGQQHKSTSSDSLSKNLNVSPVRLANDIIKVRSEQSFQETDNTDDENEVNDNQTGEYKDDIDGSHIDTPTVSPAHDDQPVVTKSHEELLEEWMLVVRRSLTELLLEVTNEEIQSIAQETHRKCKSKASSAQVFRKSALSSITGKLGLGAYADSASDDSESEEEDDENQLNSDRDSEDELRETIRSRQTAFKAVAQEIEQSARESERGEQRRHTDHDVEPTSDTKSIKKGYEIESGEPQPDKKSQHNGKRSRERTSRFSDVKDMKNRTNAYTLVPPTPMPSSSHSDFEPRKQSSSVTTNPATSAASSKSKRYSDSTSSSSSDSSDSYQRRSRHRKTHEKSHKKSSNGNSNRRENNSRDSYDSDEYSSRRSKKHRSSRSTYSRDRSPSRSRSRSQSYTGKSRR